MAKVLFYGAYGVCVVRVASDLNRGVYFGTSNVAPNAFRTSTLIPQHMTKFAMDKVFDLPGLNVSIAVWQLRCDKFFVFSARQVCIIKLEIPRCD